MRSTKQQVGVADRASSNLKMNQQKATKKYRRIKTIVKKTVDTSALCNL